MEIVHKGKALYRTKGNDVNAIMERVFSQEWEKMQDSSSTLEYLLGIGERRTAVTQDQATVAATVIQWLGSPIGQVWLKNVLRVASDEIIRREAVKPKAE
jgi:hypothetical protein